MADVKPFRPTGPEKRVTVELTVREWKAVQMFRKLKFGSITLQRVDSSGAFRVEVKESIIIDETMETPDSKVVS
jgi:hypothetical protein